MKYLLKLGLISMLSIAGLMGCATLEEGHEYTELVVGRAADSQIMDPQASNSGADALIWTQIFDGLVKMNLDLEIVPNLAESWEQLDDLTWKFHLRDDVYFHNGDHFTAADVEFTLRRALTSPTVSHIVGEVDPEGIEIVNDYTIIIRTTEPFAPFLVNLTLPGMSILNERLINEAGGDMNIDPVGTGPFVFNEWVIGERIVLDKNENYHGQLPEIDRLSFQVMPEAASRMINLETGEIDMALDVASANINQINSNNNLNLIRQPDLGLNYMGFNTQKEPFNDVRVRQAINYGINVELMIDTILEGVGSVATGPMNPRVWGYNPNLNGYSFNPERAKELLAEAGFEDGFSTVLTINSDNAMRADMAIVIQNQLSDIGIDVEIQTFESAAYNEYLDAGHGEMFILGWTNVTADPENGLFPLFHTTRHGSSGNRTFFSNARVDELLEAGRGATNPEHRMAYYFEAQEIIVNEAPWVFLNTGEILVATQSNVTDFTPSPRGLHFFDTIRFE